MKIVRIFIVKMIEMISIQNIESAKDYQRMVKIMKRLGLGLGIIICFMIKIDNFILISLLDYIVRLYLLLYDLLFS